MADSNVKEQRGADKTFDWGHWIPCIDSIPVGQIQDTGLANLLEDRSFTVFTMPKPFDWYIFGFGASWAGQDLLDSIIQVANLSEKENVSTRFLPATSFLGQPSQYNPGWLPLQCGFDETPHLHKFWAWGTLNTDDGEYGIGAWYDRKKLDFIAPFRLPQGEQLRFIVGNRCDEDFEDTTITVVGQRWMPWNQEGPLV